jgi:hypothetical protein
MSFSGIRAIILIAVLVGLVLAVSQFNLPRWLVPVGVLATAAMLRGAEKKTTSA